MPTQPDPVTIQYQTACEAYLANNKACISLFQSIAKSALLLNGMACVALLYSQRVDLALMACPLFVYAFGALLAAIATGLAYITQYYVVEEWRLDVWERPDSPQELVGYQNQKARCNKLAMRYRIATGVCLSLSGVAFLAASIAAYLRMASA